MADPNPIYVGSAMGYGGGNTSGFSDTKWNATDESTAIQTEFGYNKIVGFQIFLNKTVGEMMSIANAHSQHDSGVNQTYPIFLDETNKHLVKKVRIINPTFGNTQFPVSEGVVYNNDAGTRRKAAFVVIGNSFSGSMGNEVTDITVPALVNEDVFGSVYVGCTRIDSSRNKAQIKENVLLQLLDASGNPIEMYQPLSSDPQTVFRLIGYELVFGSI